MSKKALLMARVKTPERAEEILSLCESRGRKALIEIAPDEPEELSDIDRLFNPSAPTVHSTQVGRNDPCPCGSGTKFKKCCLN